MPDPDEMNPSEAVGEAVKGILNSAPAQNFLGPITEQLGLALGEWGDIFRFYQSENLKKIFKKWGELRGGATLSEGELRRVLPFLPNAALQSDDELQNRWAALLQSSATGKDNVLPSFGQTLSQITSEEARYIERVWKFLTGRSNTAASSRRSVHPSVLRRLYDPRLAEYPGFVVLFHDPKSPEERAAFERLKRFELILHDLERLGILMQENRYFAGDALTCEIDGEQVKIPQPGGITVSYSLTQYGVDFVLAVKPGENGGKGRGASCGEHA
jgi:hypothetical protein